MMMTARWLLDHNPDPDEQTIREAITGNICRCTGYENIVRAIRWAAAHPHTDGEQEEQEEQEVPA
jgi:carbon-monoxide dehydrogenase small subunit